MKIREVARGRDGTWILDKMETEEEVTEVEEWELFGGKRYRCIYAWLERANLSEPYVPALIQEIDMH